MFAVLTVPLAAASQATAKLAMAKAVYAVKEEIGNEWTLLTTVPKSLKVPGARASVSCKELSTTRFRCSFTATNSVGYQAYVKAG
ncbi:MAG TPA: hypothetical protein VHI77_03260 [Solirubrobacterales bacterium]|nr:hypothetical protein [Solirubrobacterales bacterium]